MTPLQALRHHVTGAVERGESQAIAGIPAKLWQVTYLTGRVASGIVGDTEEDARRAARWLHPSETIKEVKQCH